jgi:uncharacterized protein (TIGR00730 family)
MKRIAVFCGSSAGRRPEYTQAAQALGKAMARRKIGLVFGGGRVGLMGVVAREVMENGGEVIGIIPSGLAKKEVAYTELSDLRIVNSMHERKAQMAELADGFIALPGGFGTLEEFFEILTWAQLSLHHKPCGLLDVANYFQLLNAFLDQVAAEEFVVGDHRQMVMVEENPDLLLDRFEHYQAPDVDKAAWALRNTR